MSATVASVSKKMDLLEKKLALLNEELELVKTELPIESIIASLRSASPAELSQISSLLSLSASASAVAGAVKKVRGKKAKADQLAVADAAESSSTTSSQKRKVGEKTQLHNTQTSVVAALVKKYVEDNAEEKAVEGKKTKQKFLGDRLIPAGFHLKIGSILKTEMALPADASPSEEQVEEAISFWLENPDWMSPNEKKNSEKKGAEVESTPKKAKKAAEPKSLLASASAPAPSPASDADAEESVAEVPKPAKKSSVLAKPKAKKEEKKEEYKLVEGETMENLENIKSVDPKIERKMAADGVYYYVSPESNEAFTLELDPAGEYDPKTNIVSAAAEAESEDDE